MRLADYNTQNISQTPIIPRYMMYCRKSSESDERQIQSLPDQITNLTALVRQRGVELVGEPLQEQRTAKIPGRPIFGQLIQKIEDGDVNGIVLLNPSVTLTLLLSFSSFAWVQSKFSMNLSFGLFRNVWYGVTTSSSLP